MRAPVIARAVASSFASGCMVAYAECYLLGERVFCDYWLLAPVQNINVNDSIAINHLKRSSTIPCKG